MSLPSYGYSVVAPGKESPCVQVTEKVQRNTTDHEKHKVKFIYLKDFDTFHLVIDSLFKQGHPATQWDYRSKFWSQPSSSSFGDPEGGGRGFEPPLKNHQCNMFIEVSNWTPPPPPPWKNWILLVNFGPHLEIIQLP